MLSSEIAKKISARTGEETATIRRRISRSITKSQSPIARLNWKFPHRESFIYLKSDGFNELFYENLKKTANETNSIYGYIFNAFGLKKGILSTEKYKILSGCPYRISGHIGYDSALDNFKQINYYTERTIDDITYLYSLDAMQEAAFAQEKIEYYIIKMLKNWLIKNCFTSTGTIEKNDNYATFKWDITSPSYLSFIREVNKPGFVVADIVYNTIDENAIKYFLNKISIAKNQKNIPKAIPILIAKYYTPEAFKLAQKNNIIATTPRNLFGEETADLFEELLKVLINAGNIAANDFTRFLELYNKIDTIKGSSLNLAGDLFEFIVGHFYKVAYGGSLDIGRRIKIDDKSKEIDVILRTERKSHYYIECKGYGQKQLVSKKNIEEWLEKNSFTRKWLLNYHADNLPELNFGFITTSDFEKDAIDLLEKSKSKIKKYNVFYMNGNAFKEAVKSSHIDTAKKIIDTLNQHYFKIEV